MVNTPLQSTPTMRTMYHRRTLKHPHPHTNHIHGASLPVKVLQNAWYNESAALHSYLAWVLIVAQCSAIPRQVTGRVPPPTKLHSHFSIMVYIPPARARVLTRVSPQVVRKTRSLCSSSKRAGPLPSHRGTGDVSELQIYNAVPPSSSSYRGRERKHRPIVLWPVESPPTFLGVVAQTAPLLHRPHNGHTPRERDYEQQQDDSREKDDDTFAHARTTGSPGQDPDNTCANWRWLR